MLTVKTTGRARSGSTEANLEKSFVKYLKRFSYHTSDRYTPGVPDRYISGGIWVEFKILKYSGKRPVNLMTVMRKNQVIFLDKLSKIDDCYICIQFQPENSEPTTALINWLVFRNTGKVNPFLEHKTMKDLVPW